MIFLELSTFIGRLHPLVVHLPIGFLVLALIFDLPLVKKRNSAVSLIWFFASIFSIVAVVLGLLLAQNGHYIEQQLSLHQWSGIILVFLCIIGWMSRSPFFRFPDFIRKVNNGIVILTLIIVGHYGGTLTHGENYLFVYAPEWLSSKLIKEKTDPKFADVSLDSVYVYQDMIQPLFNAKCVSCHNNEVKRGGLDMSNVKGLFKGGNSGAAIVQKNLAKSLIYNRITKVQSDVKFMPPAGIPMTYSEIQLIEWWIQAGASIETPLSKQTLNSEIQTLLLKKYALDTEEKPWFKKVILTPLQESELARFDQNKLEWRKLALDNPLLDVRFQGKEISKEVLSVLEQNAPYITWLNLSGTILQKDALKVIAKMENLTRLYLQKSSLPIGDLSLLESLSHLEILNLHSTSANQNVFEVAKQLPALKKLYLWNTKLSNDQIEAQKSFFPNTDLIGGLE